MKECPYCGNTNILTKLEHDCYSSWAVVECEKCRAYIHIGVDHPNSAYPNAVDNWKALAIERWENDSQPINKEIIIKKTRGESNESSND